MYVPSRRACEVTRPKLTQPQREALEDAAKYGQIESTAHARRPKYHSGRTIWRLVDRGLLDWYGGDYRHFTITDEGRAAIGISVERAK